MTAEKLELVVHQGNFAGKLTPKFPLFSSFYPAGSHYVSMAFSASTLRVGTK
jgi:hypothetical protein